MAGELRPAGRHEAATGRRPAIPLHRSLEKQGDRLTPVLAEAIRLLENVRQELGPRSEWHSRVHVLLGLCYRQIDDHEQALLAVIVDQGQGFTAVFGHLSKILTYEGKKLKCGQLIGRVGSTGYSTGPHLHFTAYRWGRLLNPMMLFG